MVLASSFRIIDECPCMLVGATAAAAAGAGGRRCLTVGADNFDP